MLKYLEESAENHSSGILSGFKNEDVVQQTQEINEILSSEDDNIDIEAQEKEESSLKTKNCK